MRRWGVLVATVASATAASCGAEGGARWTGLEVDDPGLRARTVFALGIDSARSPALTALREIALEDPDPGVRHEALQAVARTGSGAEADWLVALDGAERASATEALARLALRGELGRAGRDSLVVRLGDPDPAVVAFAARGLAWSDAPDLWIRHRAAIRAALSHLPADDPAARVLLRAFGRVLPRAELEPWTTRPADPRTRLTAVEALASHSDGVAGVAALEAALDDRHPWVRRAAARGLAALGRGPGAERPVMPDPMPTAPPAPSGPDPVDGGEAELAALGPAPRLVLDTEAGRVVVELDVRGAPEAVLHLVRRVRAGRYDGVPVVRALPGRLVQWGRPGVEGSGTPPERRPVRVIRGVVALARDGVDGDDDLFVAFDALPELDGRHTVVGRVGEGLDVLETLEPGGVVRRSAVETTGATARR